MNKRKLSFNLLSVTLLLCLPHLAISQTAPSVNRAVGSGLPQPYEWTKEVWKGDNRAYVALKTAVDAALLNSKSPIAVAQRLEQEAKRKSLDPKAQFKWAYTMFRVYRQESVRVRNMPPTYQHLLQSASQSLSQVPAPHTYEFYRLRFLIEASKFPDPSLKAAGRRLMQTNKKDVVVRYAFLAIASDYPKDVEERKELVRVAQEVQQLKPQEPNVYAALATAHMTMFYGTHNAVDANRAIDNYQTYLRLAPANAPFRSSAIYRIKDLQKLRGQKK